ncbi:YihY/virulence factor BrkB family protein [Terrabacter sp. 2RAF25]|uniref:YihY/virulence factor BrkB family protein n=1 Tax=Terrabacter sp. 2RAF25 TaxID=3232998 RepID=UPI003F9BF66C
MSATPSGDSRPRTSATEPEPDSRTEQTPESPADLSKPSLVAVVKRARREFKRDNLTDLAASLTYYGLLSIAPALVVLVAALGLLGRDATAQVVDQVSAVAPGSSADFVRTLITQAQANRTSAGLGAVIGLLVALWSASGYVSAFMRASNVIYDSPEGRPIWKTIPIRVGVTVFAVVVMVLSAVIVVVSGPVARQIGQLVGAGDTGLMLWNVLKWPVLLLLVSVLFAVLFWASPNARQGGVKWISPGGIIAVLIWLVVSGLFAVYVAYFSSYNKTYGSLAGVVVFLVWLWLTNIAILLGAEVNAELDRGRAIAAGVPEDLEPFAEPRDTRSMTDLDKQAVVEAAERRPH